MTHGTESVILLGPFTDSEPLTAFRTWKTTTPTNDAKCNHTEKSAKVTQVCRARFARTCADFSISCIGGGCARFVRGAPRSVRPPHYGDRVWKVWNFCENIVCPKTRQMLRVDVGAQLFHTINART